MEIFEFDQDPSDMSRPIPDQHAPSTEEQMQQREHILVSCGTRVFERISRAAMSNYGRQNPRQNLSARGDPIEYLV